MSTPTTIDDYIAGLPPDLGGRAQQTRAVIDRHLAGATSAVLWGHPTWSVDGDPVCYLRATAGELLFGFWNAGSLDDPSGRLTAHGSIMGHAVVAGRPTSTRRCSRPGSRRPAACARAPRASS
jgi:hypothetical protein